MILLNVSKMNWELLIAMISVVISVSVPAITNYQNNKHQLKLKKIEILLREKQALYLEFAEAFHNVIKEKNEDGYFRFKQAINKCSLVCTDKDFYENAKACLSYSREALGDENERFFKACLECLKKDLEKSYDLLK